MESKALICAALVYGCETCKLSKKQKIFWNLSKGKILRRIFGPVRENEMWSMGYIEGRYREYKDLDRVSYVKFERLSGLDTCRRPFEPYTKRNPDCLIHWQSIRGETQV